MSEAALLALALLCSVVGAAWLALAMDAHWQQARGRPGPRQATAVGLRILGAAALLASLLLCYGADHISMAVLVWIMSVSLGVVVVALTLAWRPRWLAWLVPWAG